MENVRKPFESDTGEKIFELIGRTEPLGETSGHSVAYVILPSNCSTQNHYHPIAEETYYILKGKGEVTIDGKKHSVTAGDAILIQPKEKHKIMAIGDKNQKFQDLEFIAICAPAWEPTNTISVED